MSILFFFNVLSIATNPCSWNGTFTSAPFISGNANSCHRVHISGEANLLPFFTSLSCASSHFSCLSFSISETGTLDATGRACGKPSQLQIGLLAKDVAGNEPDGHSSYKCNSGSGILNQILIGYSTIAVFVRNTGVAADCLTRIGGLTTLQLRWIFSNTTSDAGASVSNNGVKRWSNLHPDCSNAKLQFAGPDSFSGTYSFFKESTFEDFETFDEDFMEFSNSASMLDFFHQNGDVIGFFSYPILKDTPFLDFIRISPDRTRGYPAIEPGLFPNNARYAYLQPLYIVYQLDSYSVLLYYLESIFSAESQEILQQLSYIPLSETELELSFQMLEGNYTAATVQESDEYECSAALSHDVIIFGTGMLLAVCVILTVAILKIDFADYVPDFQEYNPHQQFGVPLSVKIHTSNPPALRSTESKERSRSHTSPMQYSSDHESEPGSAVSRSNSIGALDVFVNQKPSQNPASLFEIDDHRSIEILNYDALWPYYMRPLFWHNSFCLLEPWEHVGMYNNEKVKASLNFCNFFSRIMGSHTLILPIYSECFEIDENHEEFVCLLSNSNCIVMEGGDQSTYDPKSFVDGLSQTQLFELTAKLLLCRGANTCPQIYICLGHQCTAEAHIWILKQFVKQVDEKLHFQDLEPLMKVAEEIRNVGQKLEIIRADGSLVCRGWENPKFAVSKMLQREVGLSTLQEYHFNLRHLPDELVEAYKDTEVYVQQTTNNLDLNGRCVPMLHGDTVNPEAILFANWAYQKLHPIVEQCKHHLIGTSLIWLQNLPVRVRILASSQQAGMIMCHCASTAIYYQKSGFSRIWRTYTVQFHPELITEEVGDLNTQLVGDYDLLSRHGHVLADLVYTTLHD